MASVLDIRGSLTRRSYRSAEDGLKADREAIAGDWRAVGDDLREAMRRVEEEMTEEERRRLKEYGIPRSGDSPRRD